MEGPVPRDDAAWAAWEALGSPKYVMAPMVDGSDLPFRSLCRRYGVDLCYSPMVSAVTLVMYHRGHHTIEGMFDTEEGDRPLVFQMSGNDPRVLSHARCLVGDASDAVDLNLGCPQKIAARAQIGAYLMEKQERAAQCVAALGHATWAKMRVWNDVERTVEFAKSLVRAGARVVAVHGRTKEQRGAKTGDASWEHIKRVVQAVGVPVIANGNIKNRQDADACMRETGCAAVMSAWGLLADHRMFACVEGQVGGYGVLSPHEELDRAKEWVQHSLKYVGRGHNVRRSKLHLFHMLDNSMKQVPGLRDLLAEVETDEQIAVVIEALDCALEAKQQHPALKRILETPAVVREKKPVEPDPVPEEGEWDLFD